VQQAPVEERRLVEQVIYTFAQKNLHLLGLQIVLPIPIHSSNSDFITRKFAFKQILLQTL
jgi:hypothetical protein